MNAKKIIIIIILFIFCIGGIVLYSTNTQANQTEQNDYCTIENPVGCDEIIAELQREHEILQEQQKILNKKANVYRAINDLNNKEVVVDEKLN